MSPDIDIAKDLAQKTGANIHTIHAPGTGRMYRSFWVATDGQTNMARLSEATGGMQFYVDFASHDTVWVPAAKR